MRLRKSTGLSQKGLGELLGVRFQQIQRYENGKNRLGPSRLRKAADHFGVKLEYFFADDTTAESYAATANHNQDDLDLRKVSELFAMIKNPSLRRSVIDILEGLVRSESVQTSRFDQN